VSSPIPLTCYENEGLENICFESTRYLRTVVAQGKCGRCLSKYQSVITNTGRNILFLIFQYFAPKCYLLKCIQFQTTILSEKKMPRFTVLMECLHSSVARNNMLSLLKSWFIEKASDDLRTVDSGILYELNKKVAWVFSSTGRDKQIPMIEPVLKPQTTRGHPGDNGRRASIWHKGGYLCLCLSNMILNSLSNLTLCPSNYSSIAEWELDNGKKTGHVCFSRN
ncbi:hypothetical protein U0070_011861, partial [Myodes glareolus]